jgi:NADH:ubiquinone oxidoreductase subunit 5 (subunit L)/multisubunit Na+/H+ antiporter MnhA subunit
VDAGEGCALSLLTAVTAMHGPAIALAASAASAASSAAAGRRGGFDPGSTLPWAVPLILAAPLVGYVLILGSVRSRRGAANVAMATMVVMLLATLLVGWARVHQSAPYKSSYQWINILVASTGDQRFQGFGIDLGFRIDHLSLAALVTVMAIVIASLAWHRVAGRGEQGPVRYHVNTLLFALGAGGVLVSSDLGELVAFWLLTGLGTYLLLGHRWGTEGAGRRGQVALAFPFVGDVALLCGVALLYSRFGTLTLDSLFPVLTTTLGVGLKSITAAAVLIFVAVAVRACIWPFTAWQTATVDAPSASVALAAGVWPVLAGSLLLRMLPLIGAAGVQAPRIAGYAVGVAAMAGPLLGLAGVELRRSILLASSGAVALTLLGVLYPPSVTVAFSGLLAVAAARAGMVLAGTSAAGAMRTVDMRATGGGWQRMPASSAALLVSAAVIALGGLGAAMLRPSGPAWIAFGAGLALVALSVFRPYFAVAHGVLRRRRAFEPERVRDVPSSVALAAFICQAVGAVALVAGFLTGWVGFLGAGGHSVSMGTNVLWLIAPLAGIAVAAAAFGVRKDQSLEMGAMFGDLTGALWEQAAGLYQRLIDRPGQQVVRGVEDVAVPTAEAGVGRAFSAAGGLAGSAERGLPWVPTVLALAVVLAAAFALVGEGLAR